MDIYGLEISSEMAYDLSILREDFEDGQICKGDYNKKFLQIVEERMLKGQADAPNTHFITT